MKLTRGLAALVTGAALVGCGAYADVSAHVGTDACTSGRAGPSRCARPPVGRVVPLRSVHESIVAGESGVAAVAVRNPAAIALVDVRTDAVRQTVPTDGDAVLIERIDPQVTEVARIEAAGKPYGLAFDAQRRLLFVTLTAGNQLQVIERGRSGEPAPLGSCPPCSSPTPLQWFLIRGPCLSPAAPRGSLQIVTADLLAGRGR